MKNKYEAVYILSDTIKAETVEAACENIRSDIRKVGGTITGEKPPERRAFARPIDKHQGGYYLEINFELAPDKVDALKQRHKLDANVFRVMIVSAAKKTAVEPAPKPAPVAQA